MDTITAEWFNEEKTIILQVLKNNWEWHELMAFNRHELPAMLHSVNHTVHVLVDMRSHVALPLGSALRKGREVVQHMPKNWGYTIIVTENKFITLMVNLVARFATLNGEQKIFTALSIEDALGRVSQKTT